ncbi:ABC transporter ATP-binding protein [Actinoplanes sp. CA-252034]|uniref:ABC transporter ATP-binding protein n=1 Tax=Actinoplanes sp. CA-252034 TaxID=3239906 RepID=UPI003D9799A6
MLFSNPVDPFPSGNGPTPAAGVRRFLLQELRPLRPVMVIAVLTTILCAAIEVWLIGYAGRLVDLLAATDPAALWSDRGPELLAVAAFVLLVRPAMMLLGEVLDDITFRANARPMARWRAHRYVSRQSVGWFRDDLAGRIATWVRDGGDAAATAAYSVIHTLVFVTAYIAGSVWVMSALDVRLLLPLGGWIGAYLLLMVLIVPRFRRASENLQAAESALNGLLVDSYANVDTLALLGGAEARTDHDRRVFAEARQAHLRLQRVEVTINSSMTALGSALLVGLVGYGIVLWRSEAAPLGLVAAALALSFRITSMAEWLLDAVSSLFGAAGALRQALRTIAQPLTVADKPDAKPLAVRAGAIRFHQVSHHYGRGAGGLDRLDLEIAPGERVGLVGRSGAGKSTLVGLLLRFHDLEAGTITIDGTDITDVTQASLREQIAMVAQEATLLHRSVRENIAGPGHAPAISSPAVTSPADHAPAITFPAGGAPAATSSAGGAGPGTDDERIRLALARASADFVGSLRDADGRTGLDAHVGERGVRLSGGQRQRIALARAFYRNAPILVLDEATSALDSESEAVIHDTLGDVMSGRTVIAIAHRLSTIAGMDRIVVLDDGRIAEQGTHTELLARGGLYADLWSRQSGGFLGAAST